MGDPIDLKKWLEERGVPFDWAQGVASCIKERYPVLSEALKAHRDVRCELEAIVLIRDTMTRQFPPEVPNS
jgi:hypothetical protein